METVKFLSIFHAIRLRWNIQQFRRERVETVILSIYSSMPSGYAGTFNSSDVSAWRPKYFYLYSMPSGYAGTFNSSDVSAWRPSNFYLYSMPSGYAGTFNSQT